MDKIKSIVLQNNNLDNKDYYQLINSSAVIRDKNFFTFQTNDEDEIINIKEVIKQVSDFYYTNNDAVEQEVKATCQLSTNEIRDRITSLDDQSKAVWKSLTEIISAKFSYYQAESLKLNQLKIEAAKTIEDCKNIRDYIKLVQNQITIPRLQVYRNLVHTRNLRTVLEKVLIIKEILINFARVNELFKMERISEIVLIIKSCDELLDGLSWFRQQKNFRQIIQGYRKRIEGSLDSLLIRNSLFYDENNYSDIQMIFRSLETNEDFLISQLLLHYHNDWHQRTLMLVKNACIRYFGDLTRENIPSTDVNQTGNTFHQTLCICFKDPDLLIELKDIFLGIYETAINVINSFLCVIAWHENDPWPTSEIITAHLRGSRKSFWLDIKERFDILINFISEMNAKFSFEDHLACTLLVQILSRIGAHFDENNCHFTSYERISMSHLQVFHRKQIDRLALFFEAEGWDLCPVSDNFSVLEFNEYKHLLPMDGYLDENVIKFINDQMNDTICEVVEHLNIDMSGIVTEKRKLLALIKENSGHPVYLSSSCLEYFRIIGRYLEFANRHEHLQNEVYKKLYQIYFYYIRNIIEPIDFDEMSMNLTEDMGVSEIRKIPLNCQYTLYEFSTNDNFTLIMNNETGKSEKFPYWTKNLTELLVCLKSLEYLDNFYSSVIDETIGQRGNGNSQIFSQTIQCIIIRRWCEAYLRSIHHNYYIQNDRTFAMDMTSSYEKIEQDENRIEPSELIQVFISKAVRPLKHHLFAAYQQNSNPVLPIIKEINRKEKTDSVIFLVWKVFSEVTSNMLLDAFTGLTKCTQSGRDQMMIDLQTIFVNFDINQASDEETFPKMEILTEFIQAYYLPISDWKDWLTSNQVFPQGPTKRSNYSQRQLLNLSNCIAGDDKNVLNYLSTLIQEIFD